MYDDLCKELCYKKHERIASNALLFTCGLVRLKLVEGQKLYERKSVKNGCTKTTP